MAGSARSIAGIDLFECLSECEELLEQFGGHTMAAGLSLKASNFEAFRQKFDDVVRRKLNNVKPKPTLHFDAELPLNEIHPKLMRILKQFEPFGPENMHPVFLVKGVIDTGNSRIVGEQKNHLKLHIRHQQLPAVSMDGIGFSLAHWYGPLENQQPVDLLFALDENTWNNKTSIQLMVKDIRVAK